MKWFWKINYFLTCYLFIIIVLFILNIPSGEYYRNHNWIKIIDKIFTLDGVAVFFSFFIEWVQIPLCVIILIFMKDQRTRLHFFYILFLSFLR